MVDRDLILELPKSMAERALWAREHFRAFPDDSQIDDNLLTWCFNPDDNLWYSILGNYATSSPQEKRDRELKKEILEEEIKKKLEREWNAYYQQILYDSKIRAEVLKRDEYKCRLCGKKGNSSLHIHHILKRNEGGTDHLDNLITVCPSCHPKADKKLYNPKWE